MNVARSALITTALLLSACAPVAQGFLSGQRFSNAETETAAMTEAQSCAVGFDLARAVYENLPAGRTDIVIREGQGACERHATNYLRRSGFAIRKTGGAPFVVETRSMGADAVLAVARVGGRYSVSRLYELGPDGVYGAGPASFQRIQSAPSEVKRRKRRAAPVVEHAKGDR